MPHAPVLKIGRGSPTYLCTTEKCCRRIILYESCHSSVDSLTTGTRTVDGKKMASCVK